MKDPYEKAWKSIGEALSAQSEMILWIAERILSAKEFKEFVDKFSEKETDESEILNSFVKEEKEVKQR